MIWFDPMFWSQHFRVVYSRQISDFHNIAVGRMISAFSKIEEEAEIAAEQKWQEFMSQPADEYEDMGAFAEQAEDVGVSTFLTLAAVRQSMMNLVATAYYHMFEQQMN